MKKPNKKRRGRKPKKKEKEDPKKPLVGHNPNKKRCTDFHRFMRRMELVPKLTWYLKEEDWKKVQSTGDLRIMMMRLFKRAQLLGEEDEVVVKSIAEVATILLRME